MWFWPGMTWDHNRLEYMVNQDLPDIFGIKGRIAKLIFGAVVMGAYVAVSGWILHKVIAGSKLVVAGKALIDFLVSPNARPVLAAKGMDAAR